MTGRKAVPFSFSVPSEIEWRCVNKGPVHASGSCVMGFG